MSRSVLLVLVLSMSVVGIQADTIIDENFDALTPQLGVTSVGPFSAIGGTNVDIVGAANGFALCAAPESSVCVDLDGTGGNPQGILQSVSINVLPGVDYLLSFDLIGSGRGSSASATVTFGSYDQTFNLASADTTDGIVSNALVTFATPGTANLTFTSNTPGQVGLVLDNVLLTSSGANAPEPSTALLIALPLLAAGLIGRKRLANRR